MKPTLSATGSTAVYTRALLLGDGVTGSADTKNAGLNLKSLAPLYFSGWRRKRLVSRRRRRLRRLCASLRRKRLRTTIFLFKTRARPFALRRLRHMDLLALIQRRRRFASRRLRQLRRALVVARLIRLKILAGFLAHWVGRREFLAKKTRLSISGNLDFR